MSLASSIAALAARIGFEVKTKIDATHPGVARVWVSFGYVGGQVVIASALNVASVVRTAAGRYRVHFAVAMPDANYVVVGVGSQLSGNPCIVTIDPVNVPTASAVRILTDLHTSSATDFNYVNVAIFR